MEERLRSLELRLSRLESDHWGTVPTSNKNTLWLSLILVFLGVVLGYWGFGLPNHYYQVVAAFLFVALCYHRGWFVFEAKSIYWVLGIGNALLMCFLIKLLLGTGMRSPFHWLAYPSIEQGAKAGDWLKGVLGWKLVWQASELANWQVDLTVVQGLLLVGTLFGVLFRFQPFASLVAFSLVLVSLPSLVEFQWDYAFPALICGILGLYLQVHVPHRASV